MNNKNNPTTLGERILLSRRRAQLTQAELATMCGMSSNTIARLERGDIQDLRSQNMVQLARALGVSVEWLIDDSMGIEGGQDA